MMPDNLTLFSPLGRSSNRLPERPRFSFGQWCQSELKRTLRRAADCELRQPDAAFRAKSAISFGGNGERKVSVPQPYGFEIVHGEWAARRQPHIIQSEIASYQLKIYAKSNHSNFTQHTNPGFIRV
ncbi:hypothetical protein [Afipia birgiae]|jgi:hypothetical protein|uniref:hypothetical protein n=1 Tax=Afipia birgiae TaxID=151414 RepID=UPI0012665167|nr:hypothetical protein [Afipia birgiae]MBX9821024.1 hypothetical protein [Afipia birgiae]